VVAFGDSNGDRFVDLYILNNDETILDIYIYEKKSFKRSEARSINILPASAFTLVNVIPNDYNHDGKLDVMLIYQSKAWTPNLESHLIINGATGNIPPYITTLPHPLVGDFDGSFETQMVSYQQTGDSLSVWKLNGTAWISSPFSNFILDRKVNPCKISNPHSNAFVDLDGDCLPDIFLTCETIGPPSYQIWLNRKDKGFIFHSHLEGIENSGPISFHDMNADGSIDIVFAACPSSEGSCSIHIVYNQQMGLCDGNTTPCRDKSNLCVSDPKFKFDFKQGSNVYLLFISRII
jgi:integrin alpha FG-GAP repeat containing protein 1